MIRRLQITIDFSRFFMQTWNPKWRSQLEGEGLSTLSNFSKVLFHDIYNFFLANSNSCQLTWISIRRFSAALWFNRGWYCIAKAENFQCDQNNDHNWWKISSPWYTRLSFMITRLWTLLEIETFRWLHSKSDRLLVSGDFVHCF